MGGRSAVRTVALPAALALLAGVAVVVATVASRGGGLAGLVVAGSRYVTPRAGLPVGPGDGYDGQFVYRLALAPFDLARTAYGITLDVGLRRQRIGLPVLGWIFSAGGRAALVPAALVGVNLAALAALGGLGGALAARAGRHPGWGLLLASPAGLAFAVAHDLTEVLEITLVVAGLAALGAARPAVAGVALAGAALTRETALLVVAAVALPRLVALVRRRAAPGRADLAWLLPGLAFAGWQVVLAAATGELPLHGDAGANLGAPLAGVIGLARDLPDATTHQLPPLVAQLALLVYLLVAAAPHVRRAAAPIPLAWVLTAVFSLCLSTVVWTGYDDLRFLVDLSVLTLLVLLGSPRRLDGIALASAAVWVLTLALHLG